MKMKLLLFAVGLMTAAGGAYLMPSVLHPSSSISKDDIQFVWRECSGPNGEQRAAALPLYKAVFAHDDDAATALLNRSASPNALLYPGRWSPLMVAIDFQDKAMVEVLLQHGASIDYISSDPANYTPLEMAMNSALGVELQSEDGSRIDFGMFRYLLDYGADINVGFGSRGDIAITAATLGQMDLVNELLARGYHRDLQELKRTLEIRQVSGDRQAEKDRAIATIDRMLSKS